MRFIQLIVVLLITLGGCQASPRSLQPSSPEKIKVTATILPMYLFTKAVAGEAADVNLLIPPGTEVHDYQSQPADVQEIAQSQVLVKNGLGLENFLTDTVRSAENSDLIQIDASEGLKPLSESSSVAAPETEAADYDHSHGPNPHVWLDPIQAQAQVNQIRDGLIQADPANRQTYQANAATYVKQLQQLDQQFRQALKSCQSRPCPFITFHDAFPYLAQRYQLKQIAVVELPEDSLTPAEIQRIIAQVKQYNVKVIFGEAGDDRQLLTNLSQDLNVKLRTLNSLESGAIDPQYYFTAMQVNLESLKAAFQ